MYTGPSAHGRHSTPTSVGERSRRDSKVGETVLIVGSTVLLKPPHAF